MRRIVPDFFRTSRGGVSRSEAFSTPFAFTMTVPSPTPSPTGASSVRRVCAFDLLSTVVLCLDARGGITTVNAAAETLIGRTRRALAGEAAAEFFDEAAGWFGDGPAALPEGGQPLAYSFVTEFHRGLLAPVRVRAVLSTVTEDAPAAGLPEGTAYIIEATELEDALRAERDAMETSLRAANSELLRNLAHEIKNPLGGIRGAAQLLESELVRDEDRECTSVILEEAARLQALVDRLLAPYRAAQTTEPINIHEVLEHVKSLIGLEFSAGLTIRRDYDISAPPVVGDRGRFIQIFLNLARNAAEAMSEERAHGRAQLVMKTRIARDVLLSGARVRLALRVDVIDNGPGVPPALRERIFFPLVTGRAEGSGLGLSLVKAFVEEAGGAITLESRPGRTDFTVLLPLERGAGRTQRTKAQ